MAGSLRNPSGGTVGYSGRPENHLAEKFVATGTLAADQVVPYGVESVEARLVWDADYDGLVDTGAPTGSTSLVKMTQSLQSTS